MIQVVFAMLLVAASPAALAQLYKCVDAHGKTVYTDKPLPGCKGNGVRGERPPGKATQTSKPAASTFNERDNFAARQAVMCRQAREAYKRGQNSDSVRETLRDCM